MRALRISSVLALPAALCACSCSGDQLLFVKPPAIPDGVAYVAALAEDDNGALLDASPLVRWGPDARLKLTERMPVERAVVNLIGWTEADLQAMHAPAGDVLAMSPIGHASGCDPRLTDPAWTARVYANGDPAPARANTLDLTVAWLGGVCPNLAGKVAVDVGCRLLQCTSFSTQAGCTLTVDMINCGEGTATVQLDWRGRFCGDATSEPTCAFTAVDAALAPAAGALHCAAQEECDVLFYAPPPEPLFTLDTVPVVEGATTHAPADVARLGTRAYAPLTGYISDVAVLEERIAVATHDGRFHEREMCDDPERSRVVFIDPDTLGQIASSTAPPCLSRLLARPGGFFAVYGAPKERSFGTFDREGRLLSHVALPLPQVATRSYYDADALYTRATGEAAILFEWEEPGASPDHGAMIAGVNLQSFATRVIADLPQVKTLGFAESEKGELAVSNDSEDNVVFVDTRSGAMIAELMGVRKVSSVSIGNISWFEPTHEFVAPISFEEPNVHVFVNAEERAHAQFFEQDAGPLVAERWPFDPERMIVGAAYARFEPARDAWVALFDPKTPRFLPGAMRVGFGVTGRLRASDRAVWTALPWEGNLVRITSF